MLRRIQTTLVIAIATCHPAAARDSADLTQPIRVSENGHFLAQSNGAPFFWLGDTAWPLFIRLTREEADYYLNDRARKGFTVIQAVIMGGPFDGFRPNRYGEVALIEGNPRRPNPRYFEHVDWVVDRATHYGLRMALLPTWGVGTISMAASQAKPFFDSENAREYARWLASRYRNKGIIWVLGGDTIPIWPKRMTFPMSEDLKTNPPPLIDHRPIYDAMAKGIEEIEGPRAFITYHPCGLSFSGLAEPRTSVFFGDRPWLDMNMLQSSHFNDPSVYFKHGFTFGWTASFNYEPIFEEYKSLPVRPVIDGETRYEGEPIDVEYDKKKGFWKAYDSRNAAYHAVFAGAAGHTYGNNSVHQFFDPARKPALEWVKSPWRTELQSPAAYQMQYLKALMLSRPYFTRVPDQSVLVGDTGAGAAYINATRDRNGSYAMIYLPRGQSVTANLLVLSGLFSNAWWYDPQTGKSTRVSGTFQTNQQQTFTPPSSGPERDWVLVLDDASKAYKAPGLVE